MAASMGYRPNPLVTALMAQKARADEGRTRPGIAIVDPRPYNPEALTHNQGRESALARAKALGYDAEVFNLAKLGIEPPRLLSIIRARSIRGMILLGHDDTQDWSNYDFADVALVAIGSSLQLPEPHRVLHDYFRGMTLALKMLTSRGYRHIGLALRRLNDDRTEHQWRGAYYIHSLSTPPAEQIPDFSYTELNQRAKTECIAWFKRHRPEAIVSVNVEVLEWLATAGAVPGRDFGYVQLTQGRRFNPRGWAGLEYEETTISSQAVDLLHSQLISNAYGLPAVPLRILVPPRWIEGASATTALARR